MLKMKTKRSEGGNIAIAQRGKSIKIKFKGLQIPATGEMALFARNHIFLFQRVNNNLMLSRNCEMLIVRPEILLSNVVCV